MLTSAYDWLLLPSCIALVAACLYGYAYNRSRLLAQSAKNSALRRNFSRAKSDLDTLIARTPLDPTLYRLRGSMNRELHNYDEAIADFDKAISLRSDFPDAYSERASTKHKKHDLGGAVADFDEAIKLNPLDYNA